MLAPILAGFILAAPFGGQSPGDNAASHHRAGIEHHLRRCLDDASREYARALELDPPRKPDDRQWELIRRFAPRVYVTRSEPFPLKDFIAILHPTRRLIAYHFFWEDDIDFPEDNDPCDHELMWVRFSADQKSIEKIWTYFHGRILEGAAGAVADARRHAMRPRVVVQWGKHGSMPDGWESLTIARNPGDAEFKYIGATGPITLKQYNEGTFKKLSMEGRRLAAHPLGVRLGWPVRFAGTWADFVDFSKPIDTVEILNKTRMAAVTEWNSATINRHFLTYNFRPKTEWPSESELTVRPDPAPATLEDFNLPAKSVFDQAMPRYPNVWFYIDTSLAPSYDAAVKLVTSKLRAAMHLPEYFGPFGNGEGCDFEVRLEHLQPWEDSSNRQFQHSHCFHMRYYYSALARGSAQMVKLYPGGTARTFYRLAASAHYEVEHTNPNHADVESCPICGRTGEYSSLKGNLVETVHDPLGVEFLLNGKVRGETIRFQDWERREVGSVDLLASDFEISKKVFPALTGDRNTLRIGLVVITPKE
ncbi:MAG TPA: hypothetical protein VFV34_23920 [Blastocatellia bacterium]|nr:hypothetical protein [Blastocatellia bacterium]